MGAFNSHSGPLPAICECDLVAIGLISIKKSKRKILIFKLPLNSQGLWKFAIHGINE
jgi:hypothetical protein